MEITKLIYNGNNEAQLVDIRGVENRWLPDWLTDNPIQAIRFAFKRAREFSSAPVILEYSYNPAYFKEFPSGDGKSLWYRRERFVDGDEENPLVKIYHASDLENFLRLKLSPERVEMELIILKASFDLLKKQTGGGMTTIIEERKP